MKKMFVCGNWKMNTDLASARSLAEALKTLAGDSNVEVGACPPFVYLAAASEVLKGSNVSLGAQDVYFEAGGAFTGEISAAMLLDVGCTYAIAGHSERRHVIGETDELINKKVRAALAAGLKPILCVGELLEEREEGSTEDVVSRHVVEGLKDVSAADATKVVVAYEPVWAIGTGKTATPEQANEVHVFIRSLLGDMFGSETASAIRIQYGGSVKPENAFDLMGQSEVDGALVGGASLKADSFAKVISEAERACG
ncbi:MAG: triose-phosphate isomerase [Planctomycetota bacterium]|jgi:triosephosphate isomerase